MPPRLRLTVRRGHLLHTSPLLLFIAETVVRGLFRRLERSSVLAAAGLDATRPIRRRRGGGFLNFRAEVAPRPPAIVLRRGSFRNGESKRIRLAETLAERQAENSVRENARPTERSAAAAERDGRRSGCDDRQRDCAGRRHFVFFLPRPRTALSYRRTNKGSTVKLGNTNDPSPSEDEVRYIQTTNLSRKLHKIR